MSSRQLKNLVVGPKGLAAPFAAPNLDALFNTVTHEARHEYYPQHNQTTTHGNSQNNTNRSSDSSARQMWQKRPSLKQIVEKRTHRTEENENKSDHKGAIKLKGILNNAGPIAKTAKKFDTEQSSIVSPKSTSYQQINNHKSILQLIQVQQNQMRTSLNPYLQPETKKKVIGSQSDRSVMKRVSINVQSINSQRLVTLHDPQKITPKKNSPSSSLNQLLQSFRQPSKQQPQQGGSLKPSVRKDSSPAESNIIIQTLEKPLLKVPDHPMESAYVLKNFTELLTAYERKEILEYNSVYYFGQNSQKIYASDKQDYNFGYDNERGDYNYVINDHVAYRYEILERIGKGSFGQTFKVLDHKRKTYSALKIIRNKKKFHSQALIEIQILKVIREIDTSSSSSLLKIKDYLLFRNHVCILFELLSMNLFEFLRQNKFNGVSLDLIRRFAIQLLQALMLLEGQKIIHCDLKPENILLKEPNKSGIKIIDFGSSCFEDEKLYSYIQSRFYRAPEIILGLPYGLPIDMWSFGSIMAELYIGTPLFASESERDHLSMLMEVLGAPPQQLVEISPKKLTYFDEQGVVKPYTTSKGKVRQVNGRPLAQLLQYSTGTFIDFVERCLSWNPEERMRPAEALVHEWILEGLPEQIREQHLQSMRACASWLPVFKQDKKPKVVTSVSPVKSSSFMQTQQIPSSPRSFLNKANQTTIKDSMIKQTDHDTLIEYSPRQKSGQGVQGESNKSKKIDIAQTKFKSGIQRRRQ